MFYRNLLLIATFLLSTLTYGTTLNLNDKPLSQFLIMMSDIIKKPIIMNSEIDLKVTAFANSDIPPKQLLFAVLEANKLDYEDTEQYILVKRKNAFSQYDDFQTVIYDFNHVQVTDVIKPLNEALRMLSLEYTFTKSQFVAHAINNGTSIVLSAPVAAIDHVNKLLSVYDKPQKQVRFSMAVVETTETDLYELGVSFSKSFNGGQDRVSASFPSSSTNAFNWIKNAADFTSFLSFIESDSSSRLLSKPTVTVISGESARISIGQNVPILSGQKSSQIDGDTTFQDIERIDIGLIMDVKAVISSGGVINVSIQQELSSISRDAEAIDIITDKRFVSSKFQMRDKESFEIGGLISTQNDDIEAGIPLLRNIPWVGKIFESNKETKSVRNLSIVLFAQII